MRTVKNTIHETTVGIDIEKSYLVLVEVHIKTSYFLKRNLNRHVKA